MNHDLLARVVRAVLLAVVAVSPLVAPPAAATTLVMMPFDDLVGACDMVVHGVVEEVTHEDRDGLVVTVATLRVVEDWTSNDAPSQVRIIAQGGLVNGLRTLVHGADTYVVGEEVVVFASRRGDGDLHSVAMSYSKYRVVREGEQPVAVRDLSTPLVPMRDARWDLLPPMHEIQAVTTLATLRQAVRDVAGLVDPAGPPPLLDEVPR